MGVDTPSVSDDLFLLEFLLSCGLRQGGSMPKCSAWHGAFVHMFRLLYFVVFSTAILSRSAAQADVALVEMFAKTPSVYVLDGPKALALHSTNIENKEASRNGLTLAWAVIPSRHYLLTFLAIGAKLFCPM
jgi:hypothetical protein